MKKLASLFLCLSVGSVLAVPHPLLDLNQSKHTVEFLATANMGVKIPGKLGEDKKFLSGQLKIDGTAVTGTAKLLLDGFNTGIDLRTEHMKKNYLEIQKFPDAELTITQLTLPANALSGAKFEEQQVPFKGTLALHGVTQPIEGKVKVKHEGADLNLAFDFNVPITQFGIPIPSFMGITVKDEVNVSVSITTPLKAS